MVMHLKVKSLSQRDICTLMFIAALFIIAKLWKQPKCPLVDEWIKEILYIYKYICMYVCVFSFDNSLDFFLSQIYVQNPK